MQPFLVDWRARALNTPIVSGYVRQIAEMCVESEILTWLKTLLEYMSRDPVGVSRVKLSVKRKISAFILRAQYPSVEYHCVSSKFRLAPANEDFEKMRGHRMRGAMTRFETKQLRSQAAAQLIKSLDQTREYATQEGRIRLLLVQQSEDVGTTEPESICECVRERILQTASATVEWMNKDCLNGARVNCAYKLSRALRRSSSGASQPHNQSGPSTRRRKM